MTTTDLTTHLTTGAPAAHDVSALVRAAAADRALWAPHLRFDPTARHWARLPSPDDVDLWLLTWLPSQGTELHDHGDAAAAIVVLQGTLTEVRADPAGRLTSLQLGPDRVHEVARGVVHDVSNAGPDPAVSLHAYSPRLTSMTYWRPAAGALVPVRTLGADDPALLTA